MKKIFLLSITALLLIFVSCKKSDPVITPVPTPLPVDDTAKVFLKDIVSTGLPSPYYHFEYNNFKYVKRISFASDMDVYNLHYENKRLTEMLNIKNNNQILYSYTNGRVAETTELSGISGARTWKYFFDYNSNHQLIQVKWQRYENNGNDSMLFRKAVFTYYADGNLASIDNYRLDRNNQLFWNSKIQYKDYDNGINVDDFSMLKDFFETLLYLPAVKLQKNNAGTEIITGIENDYKITNTYQYNNKLPLRRTGTILQTRGAGSGQTFTAVSQFSYY